MGLWKSKKDPRKKAKLWCNCKMIYEEGISSFYQKGLFNAYLSPWQPIFPTAFGASQQCKFITSTLALSFTYMQTLEGLIFSGIWFSFNSKTSIHLSAIILHQGRGSTGAVRALPPIEYLKFVLIRVGRWSWVNSDKHKCKIQSPIN